MADIIEKVNSSLIQHGKYNNRVYLMKLSVDSVPQTIERIEKLAKDERYTKITAKVPDRAKAHFENQGYVAEAQIPGFYNGMEDVFFMCKYYSEDRRIERNADAIKEVLTASLEKAGQGVTAELEPRFSLIVADESDIEQIVGVYKVVFESYPFPIHEPEYILQTMKENVVYFCIRNGEKIVSIASSEMDVDSQNVEMTDFATLPDYRGYGFAVYLLENMEQEMRNRGMKTSYTIARSISFGMNITFAKMGYLFGGTLTNNTDICGRMESMNIWYKPL